MTLRPIGIYSALPKEILEGGPDSNGNMLSDQNKRREFSKLTESSEDFQD